MKYLYYLVCLLLIGVLVAFSPADVSAGIVGKLNGVVADASGMPLPGANVVIQGTHRGATTDAEGYFLILSVEPGRYKLEASMVGYTAATKQDVAVRADFTTTVDFNLAEAALQAEELVVIAERPPVEPDRTFSRYVVDAEDIENVPLARTLDEVIALQPGVSLDGNLRIRGSNNASMAGSNDTFVEIDGVRLVNNDGFVAPNWMGINKSALQEVQVVTGGMEAEYGNAQAGVISLVTKEGGTPIRALGNIAWTCQPRDTGGQTSTIILSMQARWIGMIPPLQTRPIPRPGARYTNAPTTRVCSGTIWRVRPLDQSPGIYPSL